MKNLKFLLFASTASILFWGCKSDSATTDFSFKVNLKAGSAPLVYNTNYTVGGKTIQFGLVRFYMSQVALKNASGQYTRFGDVYLLADNDSTNTFAIGEIPTGSEFTAIQFGLGVDSSRNTQNGSLAIPSYDYPDGHPLNPSAQMYWSWNPGYIWMKLEGKIDLNDNGSFADVGETFSIHTGLDPAYRTVERTISFTPGNDPVVLQVDADILRFFDGYDIVAKKDAHPLTTSSVEFGYVTEIVDNAENVFGAVYQ